MLEKTSQAAISPQPYKAPEQMQPLSRTGTVPSPVKIGESPDKSVAGLQVAGDHQAPAVQTPSLAGIQPPKSPKKTKSTTLSANQRQVASRELAALGHAKLAQEVAEIAPGPAATSTKEPSILEFTSDSGEQQRWFISSAQRTGSFGKFRIAVQDTPEGAPAVIRAVKEYRLDARKGDETRRASPHNREQAMQALFSLVQSHRKFNENPRLKKAVELVFKYLEDDSKEIPQRNYTAMAKFVISEFAQRGSQLSFEDTNKLMLKPKTEHIEESAIAQENELYPLVNSPLDVQASVKRDGRVYNFSELMRGEFFDVAAAALPDVERRVVTRAMAREAASRLGEMHQAGLAHRDIKPENLFVDHDGDVQLGDWGFATRLQNGRAEGAMGTIDYAAPEIFSTGTYDQSVDVYALGHAIAVSSMGDYLIHENQRMAFTSGGQMRFPQHEALSLIANALKFDARGTLDTNSVIAFRMGFKAEDLPYSSPMARQRVGSAVSKVLARVLEWSNIDPKMCSTVLQHMVQGDPEKRMPAAELAKIFEKLQPKHSPAANRAKQLSKQLLAEVSDLDAEVLKLQAYGKAYNSEA